MTIEVITRAEFMPIVEQLGRLSQISERLLHAESCKVYANEDLAKQLKVSKRTLQNWRDSGLITFTQVGSKIYYTEKAVQQFLAQYENKCFSVKQKDTYHGK